jgi:hypothetical protein
LGDVGLIDLDGALYDTGNLTNFAGGNTSNVTLMIKMFKNTSALTTLDLRSPHFDTTNVVNSTDIFTGSNGAIVVYCDPTVLNQVNFFGKACN